MSYRIRPLVWKTTHHGHAARGVSGVEYRVEEGYGGYIYTYLYSENTWITLAQSTTIQKAMKRAQEEHDSWLLPWLEPI